MFYDRVPDRRSPGWPLPTFRIPDRRRRHEHENYDAVAKAWASPTPDGLIVHTAGFDHEKGVFRIFDVWESRDAGQRLIEEVLNPRSRAVDVRSGRPGELHPADGRLLVRAPPLDELTVVVRAARNACTRA